MGKMTAGDAAPAPFCSVRWLCVMALAVRSQEMCNLLLNMLCDTDLQFQGQAAEADT